MRLTPLDIRKQEFSRRFRGLDAEEVQAFLQMLSGQWEELLDENRRKDEKIRELEGKMAHYEKVEEALQEALQTARESSRKALENAEEKAAMIVEKAETRAEEIKRDAEQERHQMKREAAKLSGRRSEIVTRLRAFLMSEMELLARYEGDDPVGFIKLLPAEKKRLRQLSERLEQEEEADIPPARAARSEDRRESEQTESADESLLDTSMEGVESFFADESAASESPAAPEPERHVHDWTKPEESEADAHSEPSLGAPDERRTGTRDESAPEESFDESKGGRHASSDDEIMRGPGWTAHTVVSRPSDQHGDAAGEQDEGPASESDESAATRASSEEIEKIRRILSDLD